MQDQLLRVARAGERGRDRQVSPTLQGRLGAVQAHLQNVTGRRRQAEVSKLRDALQAEGVALRLVRDSLSAAQALPVIAAGVAEDRAARASH